MPLLWSECLFLSSRKGRPYTPCSNGKTVGLDSLRKEKDFFFVFAGSVDGPEVTSLTLGQWHCVLVIT